VSPVDGEPQLLYLEPDDEITSVIRRLRGADVGRVVLVAPGRSRATSSVVALRLLARAAAESGRSVALVADASTRALAGEAGVAAFASVADATSPTPSPAEPMTPTRAPIHVVRGAGAARTQPGKLPPATDGLEETLAVHIPPPGPVDGRGAVGRRRRGPPRLPLWPWLAAPLVVALAAGAALFPGATVRITPKTVAVGPVSVPLTLDVAGNETGDLESTKSGIATGERLEEVPATGIVTFSNWNSFNVDVPQGTHVSVGGTTAFATVDRVTVPKRRSFLNPEPGVKSVAVVAVEPGTSGNVAARAIDTIDDPSVKAALQGFLDNPNRLVVNDEATTGGLETSHPVIQQVDIDAVVAVIQADLQQQLDDALAGDPDRLYVGAPESEVPTIEIPDDLLGTEDRATFELRGTMSFDRAYASRGTAEEAASSAFLELGDVAPPGSAILVDSIAVQLGSVTQSGDRLEVAASVTALAGTEIDEAKVRDQIAGKTLAEAQAELRPLGDIEIDLWPSWVDRLPLLTFRIDITEVVQTPDESPPASPTQTLNQ
jgi:hypothetical protein